MANYIYKYIRNNEIIYIGKTINLSQRHYQHLREANRFTCTDELWFFECKSKREMDIYEVVLINKYHPVLNVQDKYSDINTDIEEPEWTLYNELIYRTNNKQPNENKNFNVKKYNNPFEVKKYDNVFANKIDYTDTINLPKITFLAWRLLVAAYLKKDILSV